MDDALHGRRDKRGDWRPSRLLAYPPVFVWPAQPLALLKWLFGYPGYILPWNLFYAAVGVVFWLYLTPSMNTAKSLSAGWIAFLLARNAFVVLLIYGALHLRLYVQRKQGTTFKFNGRWPATGNSAFLLGTGAALRRLPMADAARHCAYFSTYDDAVAIRRRFSPGSRLAIISAGFIGLELAAAAREGGATVTVIEA